MSVAKQESTAAEGRRRRRRSWSEEEKRRILAETLEPGASVSVVARRYDMNANLLFTWRRMLGAMSSIPAVDTVKLVPAVVAAEPVTAMPSASVSRIEIALAGGDRVIVDSTVDAAALTRVIKVLSSRR
jgi:transposase